MAASVSSPRVLVDIICRRAGWCGPARGRGGQHQFEPLEVVAVEVSEQQVGELVVPATPAGHGFVTVLGEGDQGRAPIGGMRLPPDEFSSFEGVDEPGDVSGRASQRTAEGTLGLRSGRMQTPQQFRPRGGESLCIELRSHPVRKPCRKLEQLRADHPDLPRALASAAALAGYATVLAGAGAAATSRRDVP